MKVLFITDVTDWDTAISVFEKEKPTVVFIGGDVVSDGFAHYWMTPPVGDYETNLKIINFLRKNQSEIEKTKWGSRLRDITSKLENNELFDETGFYRFETGLTNTLRLLLKWIFDEIDSRTIYASNENKGTWRKKMEEFYVDLVESYRKTETFQKHVQNHVNLFYDFISYAGEITGNVYVVKGNHDDYGDYYDIDKINNTVGCREISGKTIEVDNLTVLGLGYAETHYLRKLRPLLEEYSNKVDFVLTHAEEKRVKLIADIKPKIVFRGHYRVGNYRINDVDFVSAIFPSYVTVELQDEIIKNIQYHKH